MLLLPMMMAAPIEGSTTHNDNGDRGREDPSGEADRRPIVEFFKLSPAAIIPAKRTFGAVGYDIHSAYAYVIKPMQREIVLTNIQMKLPRGCYCRVASRSGLAILNSVDVVAGVIDGDFRGNVGAVLYNCGLKDFIIAPGDRVAQLIFERVYDDVEMRERFEALEASDRGANGFGSTGVRSPVRPQRRSRSPSNNDIFGS
jgi:dUTP pyrophosphatase